MLVNTLPGACDIPANFLGMHCLRVLKDVYSTMSVGELWVIVRVRVGSQCFRLRKRLWICI